MKAKSKEIVDLLKRYNANLFPEEIALSHQSELEDMNDYDINWESIERKKVEATRSFKQTREFDESELEKRCCTVS